MRRFFQFTIENAEPLRRGALALANEYENAVLLDSNGYSPHQPGLEDAPAYDMLLALGSIRKLQTNEHKALDKLQVFHDECRDWLFGYLAYELKNGLEDLTSGNTDRLGFPQLCFIRPEIVLLVQSDRLEIGLVNGGPDDAKAILKRLLNSEPPELKHISATVQHGMSKKAYMDAVGSLQQHIRRGDIYECNFCMDFYVENAYLQPVALYRALQQSNPSPFGGYFRSGAYSILSASPERYLKKHGHQLISQPMKGTRPRGTDAMAEQKAINELKNSVKEQAENQMIVDLVRNDLSRVAVPGSVQLIENCGVHPYGKVLQMISTVRAILEQGLPFTEAIKASFPMGSMTGAPKLSAMQLAERYEDFMRGPYSGALGYITPEGGFDFNVLIRSIYHHADRQIASYRAGSAITALANADAEYEECLLKARAFFALFA